MLYQFSYMRGDGSHFDTVVEGRCPRRTATGVAVPVAVSDFARLVGVTSGAVSYIISAYRPARVGPGGHYPMTTELASGVIA